jgi:exonuclease SbcC
VDEEEARILQILNDAEQSKALATGSLQEKTQHLQTNTTRISDLQAETRARQKELEQSGKLFTSHLSEAGFPDETSFAGCQRPANERAALENEANILQTKKTQLEGKKADRQHNLADEEAKQLTTEHPHVLAANLEVARKSQDDLLQEIGALSQKLETNQALKIRGAEIAGRIRKQTGVYDRWAALSSLIGSADGKKYRNFAQGLTLEIMVSYANNQLVKLSDRYLLTRDKNEPLELNVLDNYQAGEIRSTKNLSGGESFIVSLALALGLSRMSSRNVRVDSLFLDEGFGTLDEETLETALGTLAGLKQDGKMIGVISHVGAMKERINTRITVQPIREGRSFLSGPGCREVKGVVN